MVGKKIRKIEKITDNSTKVYDLEIGDAHHYIFGNGIVSHNSMFPVKKQSGGDGPVYAASQIVFLSKAKDTDKSTGEVHGAIITAKLYKSRYTIENKKVKVLLNYRTGLDRYYGLVDLAIKFGIFKKISNKIEYAEGLTAFETHIEKNPEKYFTKEVLAKIDEACKEEFLYGKTSFTTDNE